MLFLIHVFVLFSNKISQIKWIYNEKQNFKTSYKILYKLNALLILCIIKYK